MKTTLSRESPSKVRVAVEASAGEVAPAIERAVRKLGAQVKVPGFRRGHVPRRVLEARLGRAALREETLREAIPELLARAVEEETLRPVAPPAIDVTEYELDANLRFEAAVEVRPEISLPAFELLAATRRSTAPKPQEVEEQLNRLRERFGTLETVPRPARRGDHALIDIHTTLHAAEISELSGTDQLYEVGAGVPVPELDAELDGSRAGDILKFNATVPATLDLPQAGQEVTFQVLVKEVRQKVLPSPDDAFAKTASEFETLDELRADLVTRIEQVKSIQADAEVRETILEQVLDEVEVEPPDSLVREEMSYRLRRMAEQLAAGGVTLERYMELQGVTEEQLEADLRRQAERNVRAQLVLEEIGRKEAFTASEDDLKKEILLHASTLGVDPPELAKQLSDRNRLAALAGDIIRRKALDHLMEKAEITQEGAADADESERA